MGRVRLRAAFPPANPAAVEIICLAVYTMAGGKVLRGFMVSTIADRLGISFDQATDMADAAHMTGLVRHEHGTVILTGEGHTRGATLTPPAVRTSAPRQPAGCLCYELPMPVARSKADRC